MQVGGEASAEAPGACAHRVVACLRAALEPEGAGNDRRHRRKGDDRDQRADDEEHRADENDGGEGLDQLVGTAIEEPLELVDVVVQHRNEIAGAVFFVKTRREVLSVIVAEDAQPVLHVLCQAAPEDLVEELEKRFAEPDEEGGDAEQRELLHRVCDADLRHEGILAAHHHVERNADQDFRHDVEDLVDDRGRDGPRHAALFLTDERQQHPERMALAGGEGGRAWRDCHKIGTCFRRASCARTPELATPTPLAGRTGACNLLIIHSPSGMPSDVSFA